MTLADRPADGLLAEVLAHVGADRRVRAAVLSGSLADPAARRDRFQDVDLLLVVDDVDAFRTDVAWPRRFGEPAIVQRPDEMPAAPPRTDGGFTVMTLYRDDRRLDATFVPRSAMVGFRHDGPSVVLFDRDGLVPAPGAADAARFAPRPPTLADFEACCNEFWWVAPYVAKGLARGALAYARLHLDHVLRGELLRALGWAVQVADDRHRGIGKHGRDLRQAVDEPTWRAFEATFADADLGRSWAALWAMADLFHEAATRAAARYGFAYPEEDERHVRAHLARVQARTVSGEAPERPAGAVRTTLATSRDAVGVTCRPAEPDDLAAIAVLDPDARPGSERAARLAAWPAAGDLLVAETTDGVAGYAALEHDFFGRDFLALLVVAPDRRRRGVGRTLVRSVEDRCRGPRLFTSTNASNVPMQRLLARAGYRRSGVVDDLDPGDPEIVYSRSLASSAGDRPASVPARG